VTQDKDILRKLEEVRAVGLAQGQVDKNRIADLMKEVEAQNRAYQDQARVFQKEYAASAQRDLERLQNDLAFPRTRKNGGGLGRAAQSK